MSWFDQEKDEKVLLRGILRVLEDTRRIEAKQLVFLEAIFKQGETKLSKVRLDIMPKTVQVGQTASAVITGQDQFGNPFPLDSSYKVEYSAANPASVSFGTPNADGSDVVTAVAVDSGDVIIATITRPDGSTLQTNSDTLTVTAPVPVLTSATLVLQ